MIAERPRTKRELNGNNVVKDDYMAWLRMLSPLPTIHMPKLAGWNGVSEDLANEARLMAEDSRDYMRKLAELQLAMTHKALSADGFGALEISSEWATQSMSLASSEAQKRSEAFIRLMAKLWPAPVPA